MKSESFLAFMAIVVIAVIASVVSGFQTQLVGPFALGFILNLIITVCIVESNKKKPFGVGSVLVISVIVGFILGAFYAMTHSFSHWSGDSNTGSNLALLGAVLAGIIGLMYEPGGLVAKDKSVVKDES